MYYFITLQVKIDVFVGVYPISTSVGVNSHILVINQQRQEFNLWYCKFPTRTPMATTFRGFILSLMHLLISPSSAVSVPNSSSFKLPHPCYTPFRFPPPLPWILTDIHGVANIFIPSSSYYPVFIYKYKYNLYPFYYN